MSKSRLVVALTYRKALTMHELNSCRDSRVGCEKAVATGYASSTTWNSNTSQGRGYNVCASYAISARDNWGSLNFSGRQWNLSGIGVLNIEQLKTQNAW